MTIIDRRPGGGGASGSSVAYDSEVDGSHSERVSAALRAWNTASLAYEKVTVDDASGGLNINIVGDDVGIGGGTQYAEDTAHVTGDQVTMAGVVQQTADAALSGDGDRSLLQVDDNGYLKVNIKAGAGSGGTAATDDAAFTAGSGSGTPAMGFFSADTVDSGDVGVLAMDASRRLLVSIEADNAGIGGGTQYTEDAVAAADPVGNAQILVREDAPVSIATDGDNVALRGTEYGALYAQIVSSSGSFIDSFGGGTQYTEGATDASITGTALLWEDGGDTLATVTAANPLPVDGSGATQPISAASLPLPSGAATAANQSTIISHVDGLEALLTTIDADTSSIMSSVAVIDNSVFVDDSAFTVGTSRVQAVGAMLDDTATDSVNEGDVGVVRMSSDRRLLVDADVSGTVTANLSATDNAVLDAIQAAVETLDNAIAGSEMQVDIVSAPTLTVDGSGVTQPVSAASLPLPTGAATAANQLPDGHNVTVDNASLAVTNAGTFATQVDGAALTALQLIDDPVATISATPLQRVAIFDDSDTQITTFGGGQQYVEDAVAPAAPTGTNPMLVREDAPTAQGADGDWVGQRATAYGAAFAQIVDSSGNFIDSFGGSSAAEDTDNAAAGATLLSVGGVYNSPVPTYSAGDAAQLQQDSRGNLKVQIASGADTAAITGTGLDVNIAGDAVGIGGGTQYDEDTAHTTGDTGTMSLAVRNDVLAALAGTDGDYAPFQVNAAGALYVQEGSALDVSAATVTVDGSGVTQPVSAASLPLPTGAATAANQLPDGHAVTVDNASGASAVNIQDGGNSITVDNAGLTELAAAINGSQVDVDIKASDIDLMLGTDFSSVFSTGAVAAAHDATHPASALQVGGHALALDASPTAVASGDLTEAKFTRDGQQWVAPGHPNMQTVEYHTTGAQTNDAIIAAPGAGQHTVITGITASVAGDASAQPSVRIGWGASVPAEPTSGSTVADMVLAHDAIVEGSGVVQGWGGAPVSISPANTALSITNETPGAGAVKVVVGYYTLDG